MFSLFLLLFCFVFVLYFVLFFVVLFISVYFVSRFLTSRDPGRAGRAGRPRPRRQRIGKEKRCGPGAASPGIPGEARPAPSGHGRLFLSSAGQKKCIISAIFRPSCTSMRALIGEIRLSESRNDFADGFIGSERVSLQRDPPRERCVDHAKRVRKERLWRGTLVGV